MDGVLNDHKKVLIVSILFLLLSLSVQSYIWVTGGYNGLDFYAYEYTAKATIENDYMWLTLHPTNNLVNPHSPVFIYLLISLFTVSGSWLTAWIILLFSNAFIATYFIYKLGFNLSKNNLIASYATLLFVTIRPDGGYHGLVFPLADVIGLTFIILTLYFLTLEKPRYYLSSLVVLIGLFSHLYVGASLLLFLIVFVFVRLMSKEKISFLRKYSLVILSTIPGILYYYYMYTMFKTGGLNFSRGSSSIIESCLKYYNFMELPALYGFLHLTFAFVGILLILGKNKTIMGFLKKYRHSSIFLWSLLLLIYSQAFFITNILPNYRFLLHVIIFVSVFGGFGLERTKKLLSSKLSKMFFYTVIVLFVFISPIFYNVFAMDSCIKEDEIDVLNYIKENTKEDDVIFTIGSTALYFSDITGKKIGSSIISSLDFDRFERLFISLDLEQAKHELLKNDIRYVYLDGKIGENFKKIRDVELLYEKGNYYLFKIY